MRFSVFSKRSSTLALALALGMGGVLSVTALEAPAAAQKKKKGDEAPKPQYSKGFVAAYSPVQEQLNAGADMATVKAALPGVVAAAESEDDRFAAGNLLLSAGTKTNDPALQRQGLELMLATDQGSGGKPAAIQFFRRSVSVSGSGLRQCANSARARCRTRLHQ